MNRIQTIAWAVSRAALATLVWAFARGSALAAGNPQIAPSVGDSNVYVFGYTLVLVCVALGLAAALHSSHRSDRPRFQGVAEETARQKASTAPKA